MFSSVHEIAVGELLFKNIKSLFFLSNYTNGFLIFVRSSLRWRWFIFRIRFKRNAVEGRKRDLGKPVVGLWWAVVSVWWACEAGKKKVREESREEWMGRGLKQMKRGRAKLLDYEASDVSILSSPRSSLPTPFTLYTALFPFPPFPTKSVPPRSPLPVHSSLNSCSSLVLLFPQLISPCSNNLRSSFL